MFCRRDKVLPPPVSREQTHGEEVHVGGEGVPGVGERVLVGDGAPGGLPLEELIAEYQKRSDWAF